MGLRRAIGSVRRRLRHVRRRRQVALLPEERAALGLREGSLACVDHRGVLVPLVPGVFSPQIIGALYDGYYELHESYQADALVQPDDVILEIGAGCGFLSAYCARKITTGRIVCVEANPKLIPVVKLTHRINGICGTCREERGNGKVTILHELLGKGDGLTNFYIQDNFWASGTHSHVGTAVEMHTTSFQQRLREIRPTLLIVDIEGGEESLFDGIDLSGVTRVILELHQRIIGRAGVQKVFDTFSAQGFHYDIWHSTRGHIAFSHVSRPEA